MKSSVDQILSSCITRNEALAGCSDTMVAAFNKLVACYLGGGTVLVAGNGGSASDAEHIVGELLKGFLKRRPVPASHREKLQNAGIDNWEYVADRLQGGLPAISLVSQTSINTAFSNDICYEMAFAQQVYVYGKPGDVFIGISTSGNAKNIINALKVARTFGLTTIGLTGKIGGLMKKYCDVAICVPASETYVAQEYHLAIYHALCAMVEEEFFGEGE